MGKMNCGPAAAECMLPHYVYRRITHATTVRQDMGHRMMPCDVEVQLDVQQGDAFRAGVSPVGAAEAETNYGTPAAGHVPPHYTRCSDGAGCGPLHDDA